MDAIKRHRLLAFFIFSFVLFNVLFVIHTPVVDWWYKRIDIYSKCVDESPGLTGLYALQSCDLSSLSHVDEIVTTAFALSGVASAVAGSVLLVRLIERTWNKKKKKPAPRRPSL